MCHKQSLIESILAMLRLSIGNMDTDSPNEEEKIMIQNVCELGDRINAILEEHNPKLLIATVTLTPVLEEVLCNYQEEMPNMVTAITCKLSHHGSQHITIKDDGATTTRIKETIH